MKRFFCIPMLVLMCALLLTGCGAKTEPVSAPAVTAAPTPEPTPTPTPEPVFADILGQRYGEDTTSLNLTLMKEEDVPAVAAELGKLPLLSQIALAADGSYTALSYDALDALQAAAPGAQLLCRFELNGLEADWETTELRYYDVPVGDEGIDEYRRVLPYLPALTLLRFEDCGIEDNDAMDALRADFPDKGVVWNIYIGGYSFMTDTILMNSPMLRDDNVYLLDYMHDVLYLDVGHNHFLSNIDFVKNFPKLQAVIVSITNLSDLSPLAGCPDLEFFEGFSTNISDLSPLSGLKNLRYVNIGDNQYLADLTPLYGMELLKVRICGRTRNHVTEEMIEELRANLPADCDVAVVGGHSANSGGWRFNEDGSYNQRYGLLRRQMLYDLPSWEMRQQNSASDLKEVPHG